MIEASEVLFIGAANRQELTILGEARLLARRRLLELVAILPRAATAQIFAASENWLGTGGAIGLT